MKKALLLLSICSGLMFGQTTITSVANGDFFSPSTWDCTCFPADGDSVIINHAVTMTFGIPYTAGQILINNSGSLTNSTDLDIYINGGTFINNGLLDIGDFLLDSGLVINNGTMNCDSLVTRDNTTNSGDITAYDFVHDQYATFVSDGDIFVSNNFNNEGEFYLNGEMEIVNLASNCNILTSNAMLDIEGIMCVGGDFTNCGTDTLRSLGSGILNVGGFSTNAGEVEGTLTVNDPGGGFDLNTGTIAPTVVEASAACDLAIAGIDPQPLVIYPNPTTGEVTVSVAVISYFIHDYTGRMLVASHNDSGLIDMGHLPAGNYAVRIIDSEGKSVTRIIQKK